MIIVNSDLEEFISGVCGNKNFSIPFDEAYYAKLKEYETLSKSVSSSEEFKAVCDECQSFIDSYNYDEEIVSKIEGVVFVTKTGKYHLSIGDKYSDIHIPEKLAALMLDNIERSIDCTPLVNLCRRFSLNPKPTQDRFDMLATYVTQTWLDKEEAERLSEEEGLAEDVANKFATYMDLQITEEGYLRTSKVCKEITKKWAIKLDDKGQPAKDEDGNFVKELVDRYARVPQIDEETGEITETTEYPEYLEDRKFEPAIYSNGDKFFSDDVLGYKYEIGKLAMLESWDQVSMVDGEYHEKGLHTGGLSYIDGYMNKKRELLDVLVCPSQIGKFTNSGLGEMTAKELYIYGSATIEGTTRGLYHSSSYAKIQSKTLSEMIEEKAKEVSEARKQAEDEVVEMAEIAKALNL